MNINIISVAILFLISATSIDAQATKKASQIHVIPNNINAILVEIPKNRVKIIKTKGTRVSIEADIHLGAGTLPLLEYLVNTGRYELKTIVDDYKNTLTLSPQKDSKIIFIKGEQCPETVNYTIYVPETVGYVEVLEPL